MKINVKHLDRIIEIEVEDFLKWLQDCIEYDNKYMLMDTYGGIDKGHIKFDMDNCIIEDFDHLIKIVKSWR